MTDPEDSLVHLGELLEDCLGRIDGEVERILTGNELDDPDRTEQFLEEGTAELDDLMVRLMDSVQSAPESTDVNAITRQSLAGLLDDLDFPVVTRMDLAEGPLQAMAPPQPLQAAVRRALFLGASFAGHGGEVCIDTRREDGNAIFELTAHGDGDRAALDERCSTLRDFVSELDGRFAAGIDQSGTLLLAIDFRHPAPTD